MHRYIKRALWGAVIAGGITLIGSTAAGAAETGGEDGLLSGTQLLAPVEVPVSVVGNAISLLGSSSVEAPAPASAPAPAPAPAEASTDGSSGVGSGSQAIVEVSLPITVSDNAIAVLGGSEVSGGEASEGTTGEAAAPAPDAPADAATTSGTDGVLSGTQALLGAEVPVTVSGNAVSVLGESSVTGASGGDAAAPASGPGAGLSLPVTSGLDSLLGGTQLALPVSVPITVGGNAIGILGESTVSTPGTTPAAGPGTDPGTNPGTNPGTDPGTNPGTNPGGGSGTDRVPAAAATLSAAAGGGALAVTGGPGPLPLLAGAALLLVLGAGLMRRRAIA